MTSTDRAYFEEMYRHVDDPWEFESSLYEQRKYRESRCQPAPISLSLGIRTWMFCGGPDGVFANRCDRLLSSDIIPSALQRAETRLRRRATRLA